MAIELFLDLYKFSGHETILEVHTKKPLFRETLSNRCKCYLEEHIDNLSIQIDKKYDLVVLYIDQDLSLAIKNSLSKFLSKVECFLLITENKFNFHYICDLIELKESRCKKGISLFELKKIIPKRNNFLLTFFHNVRQPILIEPLSRTFPYVMGRTAKVEGKRTFLKSISVLFEIIFVRFLRVKFIFPGYIVIQNAK